LRENCGRTGEAVAFFDTGGTVLGFCWVVSVEANSRMTPTAAPISGRAPAVFRGMTHGLPGIALDGPDGSMRLLAFDCRGRVVCLASLLEKPRIHQIMAAISGYFF